MKSLIVLKREIKTHFNKNKTIYFVLFCCFFIGIILGFLICGAKTSYLGLINIKNKTLINIINGNIALLTGFWEVFVSFLIPCIIIFLLSLNYYLNFFNFVYFTYQSMLLFLTSTAIIQTYNILGFIKILFIIIPINIAYFLILCFWISSCTFMVNYDHKQKRFLASFDKFKNNIYLCLITIFLLSIITGFALPMLLKTAIFVIY